MVTYDRYPAVDSGYNFPPEVRTSIAAAAELKAAFMPITKGTLPNGTWLNNLVASSDVGVYGMPDSNTYTNAPTTLGSGTATLEVLRAGNSSIVQRITLSTTMFWRESIDASADNWSAWQQVQSKADADVRFTGLDARFNAILLSTTLDLNTLINVSNTYYRPVAPADWVAQHYPVNSGGVLREVSWSADSSIQTFETYSNSPRRYMRIRSVTWGAWSSADDRFDARVTAVDSLINGHEQRLDHIDQVLYNIATIPEIPGNLMPDPLNPGFYLIGE